MRTGVRPLGFSKLEHVALNSASETGAKMHQNAQICTLNFKNFLGAMPPDSHTGEGLRRPSQTPPSRRSGASRLPRLVRAFGCSIVPQPEILDPSLGGPTL